KGHRSNRSSHRFKGRGQLGQEFVISVTSHDTIEEIAQCSKEEAELGYLVANISHSHGDV
ncbi:hypothetical protein ACLOJK_036966, partial [Asimina triloba]